jgi:hypothetical protein
VALCLVLSVAIAFASLLATVAAEDAATGAGAGLVDDVAARFGLDAAAMLKLKVRQLKEMLRRKGASCDACVSKGDLVERILEVREWEDVREEAAAGAGDGQSDEERTERIRKLSKTIGGSGLGGKTFTLMGKDGKVQEVDWEEFLRKADAEGPGKRAGGEAATGEDAKTDL